MSITYHQYRCGDCDKLLFKGILIDSEIEVKCKRCGKITVFTGQPHHKYICYLADTCPNNPARQRTS